MPKRSRKNEVITTVLDSLNTYQSAMRRNLDALSRLGHNLSIHFRNIEAKNIPEPINSYLYEPIYAVWIGHETEPALVRSTMWSKPYSMWDYVNLVTGECKRYEPKRPLEAVYIRVNYAWIERPYDKPHIPFLYLNAQNAELFFMKQS